MATKRIYQIAKEFEHDEKEIIEFLTAQGIKVSNRLSAVSEDTYNMLKIKYTAPPPPPPPEPEPEPEPEPVVEPAQDEPAEQTSTAEQTSPAEQTDAPAKKKKKKKKKSAQSDQTADAAQTAPTVKKSKNPLEPVPVDMEKLPETTKQIYAQAIAAGNDFIGNYKSIFTQKQRKISKPFLMPNTDPWAIMNELKLDLPDTSPARYWQALNKLTTKAFKLVNEFGISHREILGEMRELMMPFGKDFEPREIFTDEENALFAEHNKLLFRLFGHGVGTVNDNLYGLKMYAEDMKRKYEMMNFLSYVTDPADELRCTNRVPFAEIADAIAYSISGIVRRMNFYTEYKDRIVRGLEIFRAWIEDYAKAKEQGTDAAKLERYLWFEKKLIELMSFFALDNLTIHKKKQKPMPFDKIFDELVTYRQNMDDPDAERNFKYKIRGVINVIYKPKEYNFINHFADLEVGADYRPPEEIAAAEAKAAEKAAQEAAANEESPAADDEA